MELSAREAVLADVCTLELDIPSNNGMIRCCKLELKLMVRLLIDVQMKPIMTSYGVDV